MYVTYLGLPSFSTVLLLSIINTSSIVGRIAIGGLADRFGPINLFLYSTLMTAVACGGVWLWATGLTSLIIFTILFGLHAGGFIALTPSVTTQLCGVTGLASTMGILFSAIALGHLIGPTLAGCLIKVDLPFSPSAFPPAAGYTDLILFATIHLCLATTLIGYLRFIQLGPSIWKKG